VPSFLAQPEQALWRAIVAEHTLNAAGLTLLESALLSLGRARQCRRIVAHDDLLIRGARRHPMLAMEVRSRQVAAQIFKMLGIELRACAATEQRPAPRRDGVSRHHRAIRT